MVIVWVFAGLIVAWHAMIITAVVDAMKQDKPVVATHLEAVPCRN